MCDQTEIKYVDGDIVWVKFHNFWWPGEVHGESKLPPDLLKSFRKMPVAVVKFFQENAYEYVKTINDIYRYNCIRKHEFIKKGLDLHRAKKRNMEKFPEDVRIAEEKTGGDPDIIESEEFQPEQKPNIANIFGDQTPKAKKGLGRGRRKATPTEDDLTYSRTKNLSLKSAHATPTLSTPKSYTSSTLTMNRTPAIASTSTPNANEFRCHLCNFSTTRLNVIVLHNKTHASDTKQEPQAAGAVKKTPIVTTVKKSPPKPRGRKPKPKALEPIQLEIDSESTLEEILTQTSDSESEYKKVTPKKTTKSTPKKRQTKKSTALAASVESEQTKAAESKPTSARKTPKSTRKKIIVDEQTINECEQTPEKPIEIKSKLLADWDEDDDSVVSTSKDVNSELEDIKSVVSSPTQSGDEKQPKQAIRNIPKKDRRGNILDEFYAKQVPSTTETDTEGEQTVKDDTVVIESDDDMFEIVEVTPKAPEIESTTEEETIEAQKTIDTEKETVECDASEVVESTTRIEAGEEDITPNDDAKVDEKIDEKIDEQVDENIDEKIYVKMDEKNDETIDEKIEEIKEDAIEEKIDEKIDEKIAEKVDEKVEEDAELLKQTADLLEETSLLQKDIETVGIIDKKRRLLNKHKIDEDLESSENATSSSIDENTQESQTELDSQDDRKMKVRRRSSSKAQMITQTVTKTYRSSSRRKTKSTSGDEKGQLQSNEHEENPIKGYGTDDNLTEIDEDVEMKPVVSAISTEQNDDEKDIKAIVKIESEENSPAKSDTDPSKIEVDCFDFKEEEEEMPQTLNRRKRRCLPPGKVFELQTIDKLEEIRKQEEDEKAKRIKLDPEDKEIIILNVSTDDVKSSSFDEVTSHEKLTEKQQKDDDIKDSKTLPPKERGKRIFKSRNRSRLSEGDSFSNDEKSPTKEANQSFDTIEKSLADSTIESPKTVEIVPIKTEIESIIIEPVQNESVAKEEVNSTVKMEESQIESEVANTLIFLTNSPAKVTEPIVTSSQKDVPILDVIKPEIEIPIGKINDVTENELPTSSKISMSVEETKVVETKPIEECSVKNVPALMKRKSINDKIEPSSETVLVTNVIQPPKQLRISGVAETTTTNVTKQVIVSESSNQIRDAGDGLLIKPNSNPAPKVTIPKVMVSEVSAVSSTSVSPQQEKKNPRSTRKKVPVTIGYDLQGTPIVTYRKPSNKPVVHLPSHIQTPELIQSVNPALLHSKPNSSTQFVITSKGALLKTTANTIISQTPTTSSITARPQIVRQNASTSYSQQIKSPPPIPTVHIQTHQSINPHLIHKQPSSIHRANQQQIQKHQFIQHQIKSGPQIKQQKITTNIVQHAQPSVQKANVNVKTASRPNKKQQEMLIRKQQESVITARQQPEPQQSTEVLQNAEDNQLLAVPAENFDGPAGAFYLCRITENNDYTPIDSQPLYLDEKNQLIPGNLINAVIQEELIEETLPQVSQHFEYQPEQIVQSVEEPSNLKYLLNVDGQQILLDQQSLLQLTSGGEMQQLVTADGQRLILQGSPQDILAAIQSSQQEQIIIPSDMIEEDPSNHDILAAALEDTGVFPQEQYIGDVLQIQTGNGIETVDPLAFQTINQAPTSETNAILPPIMSTLEQPSKTVPSPNVDCSISVDESLAVIGVSAPSTNVPVSLELPITVTNPAIAPKTTNAITTIYPSNVPTLTPQALHASQLSPIASDILNAATLPINSSLTKTTTICSTIDGSNRVTEAVLIHEDENCEIVPNTPESATVYRVDGKR